MGKKKNTPAGAAAGTSSSKVIDNLKTLNSDLVNEVAEFRKQIEQLRCQPDSLNTDRDIAEATYFEISAIKYINTCNGFYCDSITPNNSTSPKLWTENWTGWFKTWDKPDPHRFAEDLGNIRQPKWGNLKNLHAVIKKMEKALTYGNAKATKLVNRLSVTKFFDIAVVPGCFLANKNKTDDATLDFEGTKYFLPSWSVSILPDCKQEVYNTAKVNAQTSIMVKKPNQAEAEPTSLIWSWKPEDLSKAVQGLEPDFTTNTLRDQILASVDASEYLCVNVSQDEQMSLQMNTAGHILHAFVNGDLIGSEYAPNGKFSFVFEKEVVLNQEMNIIALLSATVKSIGNYNDTIDLSFSKWSYKVGLNGKKQQVSLDNSNSSWNTGDMFPKKVPFTWYKIMEVFSRCSSEIGRICLKSSSVSCHYDHAVEPNTLVLFEEAGIDPSQVASFGDPQSTCGSFQIGSCNVDSAFGLVRQACVGQAKCSVPMDEKTFGASQCNYSSSRRLADQATCA
ncbi:hypothetical protein M5K25_001402 [Dendrobium thyrsiflorum]|uniref:beta-galactosidase n=1 Tax=Dendrobium thyrsiflorum TaxID=117978 RepID=A0ABD0W0K4_DENTH